MSDEKALRAAKFEVLREASDEALSRGMTEVAVWLRGIASTYRAGRSPNADERFSLPLHRTEAGYPNCATCDGGGCLDCTDPA